MEAWACLPIRRRSQRQVPFYLCSASAVPLTARASLAPLLARLLKTFINHGAYLYKELLDGSWQSYFVSLVPVGVAVGISVQLCIGLEFEIQVAVLRSFVQMLSLGLLLKFFIEENIVWSLLGITAMVFLAGSTAGEQSRELPKSQVVATASLAFGTLGTVALLVFLRVLPREPSFLIPVTGHILGNAMIMVGRTLKALQYEISQHTGQSIVYVDEFASRQSGRSGAHGRVQDSALKHYVGDVARDILVFHRTCSPDGPSSLYKLKALCKVTSFKTIPTNSSLGKIVFVRRSKLVYLYDDKRSGALHTLVGLGAMGGINDPQLILRDIEGESIILPALQGPNNPFSEPSNKRRRM